jgi:hypothetical protein
MLLSILSSEDKIEDQNKYKYYKRYIKKNYN